jgi:hypothetical protein
MPHEVREVEASDDLSLGGRLKGLRIETRGARTVVTPITGDKQLLLMDKLLSFNNPDNRFKKLHDEATKILAAAGFRTLAEVRKLSDESHTTPVLDQETADRMFEEVWLDAVRKSVQLNAGRQSVQLIPIAIAANFLLWSARSGRRHFFSESDRVTTQIAFADAWRWLHLEVFAEHRDAYGGVKQQQALAKSAPARRARKGASETILEEDYLQRRATAKNPEAFKKATSAASLILNEVNARLREQGLEAYTENTMAKKLGPAFETSLNGRRSVRKRQ